MKEISPNKLNFRNEIAYEINSHTPFTGYVIKHYDDGEMYYKNCYKDGQLEGESISYYSSGQWKAKVNYKKGEPNGPYEFYYENGQLRSKGEY